MKKLVSSDGKREIIEFTQEELDVVEARRADPTKALEVIRNRRKQLLKETDFTQLLDARSVVDPTQPMSDEERAEWAEYRQSLRDLPAQEDKTFPEPPVVIMNKK